MKGTFYGIGVGPGDPDFLTVKAVKAIQASDVVIAPRTEKKGDSTALSIARPHINEETEILELVFPMVYHEDVLNDAWKENKEIILNLLNQGKTVSFLTLGDPMFYSTYIYVYRLLENCGHNIITIPGITAFCAIGSRLGFSLAEGDEVLSIIPATVDEQEIDRVIATADNVVLMKVSKNFPLIVEKLKNAGMLDNAVMISKCGLEGEEIVYDLASAGDKVNYLSTILARKHKI